MLVLILFGQQTSLSFAQDCHLQQIKKKSLDRWPICMILHRFYFYVAMGQVLFFKTVTYM